MHCGKQKETYGLAELCPEVIYPDVVHDGLKLRDQSNLRLHQSSKLLLGNLDKLVYNT